MYYTQVMRKIKADHKIKKFNYYEKAKLISSLVTVHQIIARALITFKSDLTRRYF